MGGVTEVTHSNNVCIMASATEGSHAKTYTLKGATMDFKDITEEQKKKAAACKTPEDLLALANNEGIELSDDDLQAISGGGTWDSPFIWDCSDYVNECPNDCLHY